MLVYYIDQKSKLVLGIAILLTFLGMVLNKYCLLKEINSIGLNLIANTLICCYPFICGIYVAKNRIFARLSNFSKIKINNKACFLLLLF